MTTKTNRTIPSRQNRKKKMAYPAGGKRAKTKSEDNGLGALEPGGAENLAGISKLAASKYLAEWLAFFNGLSRSMKAWLIVWTVDARRRARAKENNRGAGMPD